MAKIQKDNPVDRLTNLLLRINQGDNPQVLRKEANRIVSNLAPKDFTSAQNRLVDYGYSEKLVHQLSATFLLMGLFEIRKGNPRADITADHIVYQVSTEHDLIRCYLADLESVVAAINKAEQLTDTSSEFRRLCHLVQHLNATSEHFAREQDVIFPALEKHQFVAICSELKSLQADIDMAVNALTNVTMNFKANRLEIFKSQLTDVTDYLVSAMLGILVKEDNELYAVALKTIDDQTVWKRMKWVCDEIGYCGVHG